MALEDYTKYIEVDPLNHITPTAHHIDFIDRRDESAYLYSDKGTGYFRDFIHHLEFTRITHPATGPWSAIWCLANAVGDNMALRDAGEIMLFINVGSAPPRLCLSGWDGTDYIALAWHDIELGTKYYLKIVKKGRSYKLHVYNNADRAPEHEYEWSPLETTLPADWSFRYIYACQSLNNGNPIEGEHDIDNLDLEAPPPPEEEVKPTLAEVLARVPATIWGILALIIVVVVVAIYVARKK
ncbi:MAG: hypothetical protein HWN68_19160 [Desulfobacterales bacterium]|nr:hypothetical protein [Desulfobacterales bacterium]